MINVEHVSKLLYFKVWENAGLPYAFFQNYSVHRKEDYFIKDSWKEHFKERCVYPSKFFELGYEFWNTIIFQKKSGGLIIHQLPGQGYYDHGFYNYQPTFFFDLALANNYQIFGFWMYDNNKKELINVHKRENYLKLFVRDIHPTYYDNIVLYKTSSKKKEEFRLPTQHIYSKTNITAEEKKLWDENKK